MRIEINYKMNIVPFNKDAADMSSEATKNGESLVSLLNREIAYNPYFKNRGYGSVPNDILVRKSVAEKLEKAQELLPPGLMLKVYDGYRTEEAQTVFAIMTLYNMIAKGMTKEDMHDRLFKLTGIDVGKDISSIRDFVKYFAHNTGGAVDLTIMTDTGYELDMGSKILSYGDNNSAIAFNCGSIDTQNVQRNRQLLYSVMSYVGFVAHPDRWWQYEYGTWNWASHLNKTAPLYKCISQSDIEGCLI